MPPQRNAPVERGLAHKMITFTGSTWGRFAVWFVVGFTITPMLIGAVGFEMFGLWVMIANVTVFGLGPLLTAVTQTINRELTAAYSSGDDDRLRSVFSNGLLVSLFPALLVIVLGVVLAMLAPVVFRFDEQNLLRVRVAIIGEAIMLVQIFLSTAWTNLYFATHRVVEENIHEAVVRLLDLVAAGLAFYVFTGFDPFIAWMAIRVTLSVLQRVGRAIRISLLVPAARFSPSTINAAEVTAYAKIGGWSLSGPISNLGLYTADQILLNIFFGPIYNGMYGVVSQLRGYVRMPGSAIAFGGPSLAADLHERGETRRLNLLMLTTMRMTCGITAFCAAVMVVFVGPLVEVWLGSRLLEDPSIVAGPAAPGPGQTEYTYVVSLVWLFLLILIPGEIIRETHLAASRLLYGMGHIRRYAPALLVGAVAKPFLALIALAFIRHPLVLPATTLLVLTFNFGLFFPLLIRDVTGIPLREMVWRAYARPILAALPTLAVSLVIVESVEQWTLFRLGAAFAGVGLLYVPVAAFLVAEADERRRVLGMARSILARLRRRPAPGT